jgi:hypothetical protein
VDGSPVEPGTYTFPSEEEGTVDYNVANGRTFYVVIEGFVVESNIPVFPTGATYELMFVFDYAAGRSTPNMFLFINFGGGFIPFLNEGVMMANIQLQP